MLKQFSFIFTMLIILIGCNDNIVNNEELNNSNLNKHIKVKDKVMYYDVYVHGYVRDNGIPLANKAVQIVDENLDPFVGPLVDVVYTNSAGYYSMEVCGFGTGLRHMKVVHNGITTYRYFITPVERDDDIYIGLNITVGNSSFYNPKDPPMEN